MHHLFSKLYNMPSARYVDRFQGLNLGCQCFLYKDMKCYQHLTAATTIYKPIAAAAVFYGICSATALNAVLYPLLWFCVLWNLICYGCGLAVTAALVARNLLHLNLLAVVASESC
ncbi:uncharacterized protein LOC131325480 [Rhododendron vialii]|uniref:uncharacterized protein LOC131325480 n=1 Tax=Rhododendron vialii TaxID=182163 RepID=UPI00265EDBB7|nr:uncharacterized protein LOC131325480 [Rhododendron vialii]